MSNLRLDQNDQKPDLVSESRDMINNALLIINQLVFWIQLCSYNKAFTVQNLTE